MYTTLTMPQTKYYYPCRPLVHKYLYLMIKSGQICHNAYYHHDEDSNKCRYYHQTVLAITLLQMCVLILTGSESVKYPSAPQKFLQNLRSITTTNVIMIAAINEIALNYVEKIFYKFRCVFLMPGSSNIAEVSITKPSNRTPRLSSVI